MKQAYEKLYTDFGNCFEPIEVLPYCKRVTKLGYTYEYQQVRKRFLGFISYKKWVLKDNIRWYPKERVEYYECSCGKE